VSDTEGAIRQVVQDQGYSFPILLDPSGSIIGAYEEQYVPTQVFVDYQSVVRFEQIGGMSSADMAARAAQYVQPAPTTTTLAPLPTTTTTTPGRTFPDVPPSHPYATAIYGLAGKGIVNGLPDGTFGPEQAVVRQQFAKMIVLTLGLPVSESYVCPFGDVDDSGPSSFYPDNYIAVCAQAGITLGTSPGGFSPWNEISRAQLITMVGRAANLADPPTSYAPPFGDFSDTHYPWARRAAYAGLLAGLQGVGPAYDFWAPATRGEVASVLSNLLGG
jgi:hypothetical protein